jgi:competence protein ComEC
MAQVSGSASMPVSAARFMVPFGFAAGVVGTAALPQLPTPSHIGLCLLLAAGCCVRRRLWPLAGLFAGVVWAASSAQTGLQHRLGPGCAEATTVQLQGVVVGLPRRTGARTQFDVAPASIDPWPACAGAQPRAIRLGWDTAPDIAPGEIWRMWVRLRSVRGYQNPGGFDYEGWAFANGIDAAGAVRYGVRAGQVAAGIDRWRLRLRELIERLPLRQPGIVLGLVSGDAALLDESDWQLFRATGTVHLLVISGLHVGIVAAVGAALGHAAARLWPQLLRRSGTTAAAACGGVVLTTLYAALAGLGVPVQRAWWLSVSVLLLAVRARKHDLPTLFARVLALLLITEPSAPLRPGFWLSFGAFAVLLGYFAPRLGPRSTLRDLVRAQGVLACTMVPLLAASVGQFAWIAPLANLLAVPWVSLLLVPLDLCAALLLPLQAVVAGGLFGIVDSMADVLVQCLRQLATLDTSLWFSGDAWPVLVIAGLAAAIWLLPLSLRQRLALLPCLLLPALPGRPVVAAGQFRVTVFDVGQGLAVLVDTADHHLLYDAGPRYPSGHDLGDVVVVPSLHRLGIRRLDLVVLSHSDVDHVGGYDAVASAVPVRALRGGQSIVGHPELRRCRAGQRWRWDGVRFEILHPAGLQQSDNDRSCVLLIDNGQQRALLPGDISSNAERALLRHWTAASVDLLVVAHHGSRGSSSAPLLERLRPCFALVSAGYRNRFGHPHNEVVSRLVAVGARVFDTANAGALQWQSDRPKLLIRWRERSATYWRAGCRAGCELSMNITGTRHTKNTTATARNESLNASVLP